MAKKRFGERPQRIAQHRQCLAFAQVVAQNPREHFDHQGGGLGHAFDQAHLQGAGTQHPHHEQRQQAVDHFR